MKDEIFFFQHDQIRGLQIKEIIHSLVKQLNKNNERTELGVCLNSLSDLFFFYFQRINRTLHYFLLPKNVFDAFTSSNRIITLNLSFQYSQNILLLAFILIILTIIKILKYPRHHASYHMESLTQYILTWYDTYRKCLPQKIKQPYRQSPIYSWELFSRIFSK